MSTQAKYRYLESRPNSRSKELFVRGTGIRASTVWHDRYVSRLSPDKIAQDREMPAEAVYEALAYCQENWEAISNEKDQERERLAQRGFFEEPAADR